MESYEPPGGSEQPEQQPSGSEPKRKVSGSSSSRPRPSRAGARSVSTLSATQLERKRANDREAQRAIRQRTKEHIESLERRIAELTAQGDVIERLNAALQRNRELEQENAMLRSRLGSAAAALGVQESSAESSLLPVTHSPPGSSFHAMTRARSPSASTSKSIPATTPQAATSGQAEIWHAQQRGYSPVTCSPPVADPSVASAQVDVLSQGDVWRAHEEEPPRPQPFGGPHLSGSTGYGYVVDSSGQPVSYRGDHNPMHFATQTTPSAAYPQRPSPQQPHEFETRTPNLPQPFQSGQSTSQQAPDFKIRPPQSQRQADFKRQTPAHQEFHPLPSPHPTGFGPPQPQLPQASFQPRPVGGQVAEVPPHLNPYGLIPSQHHYIGAASATQQTTATMQPGLQSGSGVEQDQHYQQQQQQQQQQQGGGGPHYFNPHVP